MLYQDTLIYAVALFLKAFQLISVQNEEGCSFSEK